MVLLLFAVPAQASDLLVGPAQPYLTLADAIAAAVSGDRVLVDPGTYVEPRLTVDGLTLEVLATNGPGTVVLLGTASDIFDLRGGAELTVSDLEVDGEGSRRLATVGAGSTLAVVGCDVHDTDAGSGANSGGAVVATNATLAVTGTTFATSSTDRRGGFLSLTGTVAVVSASSFTAGHANERGGAISAEAGSALVIDTTTFDGNSAVAEGGAVSVDAGSLAIVGSTFRANTSDAEGTVRCSAATTCDVTDTLFDGNVTVAGGAALSSFDGPASVLRATVCRSSGTSAVRFDRGAGTVTNSILLSNTLAGAAIVVDADATGTLVNNTFATNVSTDQGTAAELLGDATLTNNLVAWSDGAGAAIVAGAGTVLGGYNAYWLNAASDTEVALTGDLVGVAPGVLLPVTGGCDAALLVPPATSPLVDAGDPAIVDPDGSPSDIGAWGGPQALDPADADADGWSEGPDCDDANPNAHPGVPEIACNGFDDDCWDGTPEALDVDLDGVTTCAGDCDDTDPYAAIFGPTYTDADDDGYGVGEPTEVCGDPPGTAGRSGDCDDTDASVYPAATEIPYDGIDQDCTGADLDDLDADGSPGPRDCDDQDPSRSPDLEEVPDDGIDQDCTERDASASLSGGSGARCGCSSAAGGAAPLWLLSAILSAWSRAPRAPRGGSGRGSPRPSRS